VLGVDQYHGLGRQSLRRVSPPGGEVASDGICRVGPGCGRKRAPKKINAPAGVTRRVTGVPAELRGAEVPRSSPPSREGPVVILGVEGPDIEVLDAVFPVQVVQGSTLAESPAQQTTGISSGAVRIPAEELGLCVGGQGCESKQASYFDPRQRPIAIRAHAAILSRPARSNRSPTSGPRQQRAIVSRYALPAPRRWREQNAAMITRSLVDLAESAGEELALRLRIPCDIVDVHRLNNSRARIYSNLRYGAFLLAYAPLESFFTELTRYAERANGRALPLNLNEIQRELALQWPGASFQANLWEGRTR
jgi:hypothetical protein